MVVARPAVGRAISRRAARVAAASRVAKAAASKVVARAAAVAATANRICYATNNKGEPLARLTFFCPCYLFNPWLKSSAGAPAYHKNHVATRPAVAAKIAAVVIQPRMFMPRLFTRSPMILRLLVINMISNSSGGVEKPCTMPE